MLSPRSLELESVGLGLLAPRRAAGWPQPMSPWWSSPSSTERSCTSCSRLKRSTHRPRLQVWLRPQREAGSGQTRQGPWRSVGARRILVIGVDGRGRPTGEMEAQVRNQLRSVEQAQLGDGALAVCRLRRTDRHVGDRSTTSFSYGVLGTPLGVGYLAVAAQGGLGRGGRFDLAAGNQVFQGA